MFLVDPLPDVFREDAEVQVPFVAGEDIRIDASLLLQFVVCNECPRTYEDGSITITASRRKFVNYAIYERICDDLIHADTEQEAIDVLKRHGYWDDPSVWRALGDDMGNLSTVANQQSDPIAALTEKLTNSIDARIINACHTRNHQPSDPNGPRTPQEAVAVFIRGHSMEKATSNTDLWDWAEAERARHAQKITVAITGGKKGVPASVSIADEGEGQQPGAFPNTFCSLSNSSKDRIPFAQGRYNMGGTGSLRFCGDHHLQLIVSRRNPHLAESDSSRRPDNHWGFTIIRRENPEEGHKNVTYKYLTPVPAERLSDKNGVLHFPKEYLCIFPDESEAKLKIRPSEPYGRSARHGTFIKMYNYLPKLSKDGVVGKSQFSLLRHIELCLVDMALPVRLYDCRRPSNDPHNPQNAENLYGIIRRLGRTDASAIEQGFPDVQDLKIQNEDLKVKIFALGCLLVKVRQRRRRGCISRVPTV